jgi:hypothetical protein
MTEEQILDEATKILRKRYYVELTGKRQYSVYYRNNRVSVAHIFRNNDRDDFLLNLICRGMIGRCCGTEQPLPKITKPYKV